MNSWGNCKLFMAKNVNGYEEVTLKILRFLRQFICEVLSFKVSIFFGGGICCCWFVSWAFSLTSWLGYNIDCWKMPTYYMRHSVILFFQLSLLWLAAVLTQKLLSTIRIALYVAFHSVINFMLLVACQWWRSRWTSLKVTYCGHTCFFVTLLSCILLVFKIYY